MAFAPSCSTATFTSQVESANELALASSYNHHNHYNIAHCTSGPITTMNRCESETTPFTPSSNVATNDNNGMMDSPPHHILPTDTNFERITSPPLSSKQVSPTSIIRPRSRSIATWVPLVSSPGHDEPPLRKLSFNFNSDRNEVEDDEFILVRPRKGSSGVCREPVHQERPPLLPLPICEHQQTCEPRSLREVASGPTFRLKKRENPLKNPFSSIHNLSVPSPLSSRPNADVGSSSSASGTIVPKTPMRTRTPLVLTSPPPCRQENGCPRDCLEIPDKLFLPSV